MSPSLEMAVVVFLRGVNVGGHRTFRPSALVPQLRSYDVVNIGAAGTFVVRKPGTPERFRAALLKQLPFDADVALCDGAELMRLAKTDPFADEPSTADIVRFVSVMSKPSHARVSLPVAFPREGKWLLRVIACRGPFVCGVYRRNMKAIGYLGQIDKLYGVPVTTRNWNTIMAIVRVLNG